MSKGLLQGHKIKISQIIKNAGKTTVYCATSLSEKVCEKNSPSQGRREPGMWIIHTF